MTARKNMVLPNVVQQAAPGNVSAREYWEVFDHWDPTKTLQVVAGIRRRSWEPLANTRWVWQAQRFEVARSTEDGRKRLPSKWRHQETFAGAACPHTLGLANRRSQ